MKLMFQIKMAASTVEFLICVQLARGKLRLASLTMQHPAESRTPFHAGTTTEVHPLSQNPTDAWAVLQSANDQVVHDVQPMDPDSPVVPNRVRFVCISDTHGQESRMPNPVPYGDVLLHAGDFTNFGGSTEVQRFNQFLGQLPHKHKIVIAGNHEISFDPARKQWLSEHSSGDKESTKNNRDLITNAIYLEDSEIVIYGLKIYGTPWQPEFGGWAFNLPRGEACLNKWNAIPQDTDILLTHSPPLGHGDLCRSGCRDGCLDLLASVQRRIKPRFHVFGHIHEGYGVTTDGTTTYINCSTCTTSYQPTNPAIIFDVPLPAGQTKDQES